MRLLIIGDLSGQLIEATKIASKQGAEVRHSTTTSSAIEVLRNGFSAELVFIDAKLDIKVFKESLEQERIYSIIIACGFDSNKDDAVKAIKAGAKEYLPLPPDEELIASIFSAISSSKKEFIAESEVMKQVLSLTDKVAPSDATVLITGESGTGKEVMARYIHENSRRKNKKFISVNCAAIPENLLESEMFGHEKGSFTGAIARRIGKFEEANGGTLLLDEISEIDIKLQAKLLRAIQEREIERIGGSDKIKLDLRIIATSNRNLQAEVKNGRFREDLFFRLNIININLPKLHERKEDIIKIAEHYINIYALQNNIFPLPKLTPSATNVLLEHHWPGNVRELENTMYRAVLLCINAIITENELMLHNEEVEDSEKSYISSTLRYCLGNYSNAAQILGITIKKLEEKIKLYDIEL